MKKVKFIYNPTSGDTIVASHLDRIVEIHQQYGYEVVMHRLSFADVADIVDDISPKLYHHIMIAGGDGTVNYIINLLKTEGRDIPIAVLPTGTANDFASMLGIPNDIEKACHAILGGCMQNVDLGIVNNKYFVNVLSCGLFTDVSQRTPTILKNTFGKLAYYVGGLGELPKFRRMTLKIESDGGNYEGHCLIFFVFNGQTAGQLRLARNAKVDDGLLDVLVFKGDNPLETIRTVFHYLSLIPLRRTYPAGVEHIRCSRLTVQSLNNENTDIDGQAGPDFPLDIRCDKSSITVLAPSKSTSR